MLAKPGFLTKGFVTRWRGSQPLSPDQGKAGPTGSR